MDSEIKCLSCDDPNLVFVFGSNEAGRHGAGAALHAKERHGAENGKFFGPFGFYPDVSNEHPASFAIPTKSSPHRSLPLSKIKLYVDRFIDYARNRDDLEFNITRVGCGLAGYGDKDIGPMFRYAPGNCLLPEEWK